MPTTRNIVTGLAVLMLLVMNAYGVFSLTDPEYLHKNLWFAFDIILIAVLLTAGRMLIAEHRKVATFVWIVAAYMIVTVIVENFISEQGDDFWLFTTAMFNLALIYSAMYLVKK